MRILLFLTLLRFYYSPFCAIVSLLFFYRSYIFSSIVPISAFGLPPPENAVAHGKQEGEHSEEKLYSIIAISDQFGEIPGNTATVEKS